VGVCSRTFGEVTPGAWVLRLGELAIVMAVAVVEGGAAGAAGDGQDGKRPRRRRWSSRWWPTRWSGRRRPRCWTVQRWVSDKHEKTRRVTRRNGARPVAVWGGGQ
jgi:hypothetical protein